MGTFQAGPQNLKPGGRQDFHCSVQGELCWGTAGSTSPLKLLYRCQDLQALAVGARGLPSLTNLSANPKRLTLLDPVPGDTSPPLGNLQTAIPTSWEQMLTCLLKVPFQL